MTRRRALLALLIAACVVAGIVVVPSSSSAGDEVAVDVVFDDARGLLPGQLAMVAGARVGTIKDVTVTDDDKARVHLRVDARFAPFRADATCTIKPQGLIAENYVECDPGTQTAEPLRAEDDHPPTVPVEQTTQPVSLTDLFEVWNTPTTQRLGLLLATLGVATSGRGEDVNAILRRANPSLALARKTIGQLRSQRDDLATAIDDLAPVTRELARSSDDVERLVRSAGRVASRTAAQRGALGEGLRRLPGLLGEAGPALQRLDAVMAAGRPLLDQLAVSAPDVNRLSTDIPRLSTAARPALRALGPVLERGAATAKATAPLSRTMRKYAAESLPSARLAGELFPALDARGTTTDLLTFIYNTTLANARYDAKGHLLPAHVGLSSCARYATRPSAACGALTSAPARKRAKKRRPRDERPAQREAPATPSAPGPSAPQPDAPKPAKPVTPKLPALPSVPLPELPEVPLPNQDEPVDDLLDFLLG